MAARSSAANTATATPAVRVEPVRFATYIQALALEIRKVRSGERTKYRLMLAGIALLEQTGFRELNIDDVAKSADVAKGTFYIHFKTKDEFLVELCRRFVDFEQVTMPALRNFPSSFASIRTHVAWYERTFAQNIGVLRCLIQMGEVSNEMRLLWHERNRLIMDRIMHEGWGLSGTDPATKLLRLAIRTAGGMLDQSLLERHHIQVGPGREAPDDIELLIELQSLLIYRTIFGSNPPEEELSLTRALLTLPAV